MTSIKNCNLTIDYEIFFGNKTGTVNECMIEPTKKLASILEKNHSTMTVFWDILHYYKLLQLENKYPELKQDRILIEDQILSLAERGFDIQLHLHPHWLDSRYENNEWKFNYTRFKLHNLSQENNPQDINTISGCVSITKNLMQDLIRKVDANYKVTTFRAGGYLIEPFELLRNAFLENEITIDSSILPGMFNENIISPYNFRSYPERNEYRFDRSPKEISDTGSFFEIPVTTIKMTGLRNTYYRVIKKLKYPMLENERKGNGVASTRSTVRSSTMKTFISSIFFSQTVQFTTDSNFKEKFNFLFRKVPENSTMILHPKLLNLHTIKLLEEYILTNKVRFNSIQKFLR